MDDIDLLAIAFLLSKQKKKIQRRYWIHPLNSRRIQENQFFNLGVILRAHPEKFFDYYRMSQNSFDELLCLVRENITKQDTHMRLAISAEERLTITLRFLATGQNLEMLKFDFLMGSRTVASTVKETCKAIWEVLQPLEMHSPSSKDRWDEISANFYKKTNFPNCLGAVDGKHLRLICPHRSGSNYYNYITYFSIVLLAVVDADYRFIGVDVGAYGRESDSQIFNNWTFGNKLARNELNLPGPKSLPNTDVPLVPYVFLGDEAFALNTHFLRPYPRNNLNDQRRVFNYRLSRARRLVECTFGILSNKWRIFHTNMTIPPDFAVLVTKAACVLHNFVRARDGYNFEDSLTHYFENNQWRCPQHRSTNQGRTVRDLFAQYFVSPTGELPWQYQRIMNH